MDLAALGFRFFLGSLLVAAALAKLPRRVEFEQAVLRYELVPQRHAAIVATWLPRAELVAGVLLLLGLLTRAAAAATGLLLLTFALAVSINLARGRTIDCGCFTQTAPRAITRWIVVRNVLLAASALLLTLEGSGALSIDQLLGARRTEGNGHALAMLISSTIALAGIALIAETVRLHIILRRPATGQ